MSGFKQFLLRGNLVDLAVGIVIGAAFTAVVNALVADIITPLIAAIFGQPNFENLYFTINHSQFKYGLLINALISFLIVGAVLYFLVVSPYARFQATFTRAPEPAPPMRDCPYCLESIPAAARKCSHCTSDVEPVPQEDVDRHGITVPSHGPEQAVAEVAQPGDDVGPVVEALVERGGEDADAGFHRLQASHPLGGRDHADHPHSAPAGGADHLHRLRRRAAGRQHGVEDQGHPALQPGEVLVVDAGDRRPFVTL